MNQRFIIYQVKLQSEVKAKFPRLAVGSKIVE